MNNSNTKEKIQYKTTQYQFEIEEMLNSYLNDSSIECFKKCITDFSKNELDTNETTCLNSCYSKYFMSYSNISEILFNQKQ